MFVAIELFFDWMIYPKRLTTLQRANRLFVRKRHRAAEAMYLKCAKRGGTDAANAYCGAAMCRLATNTLDKPERYNDDVSLVFVGDAPGAQSYFRKALEISPNHLRAMIGLARILERDAGGEREKLVQRIREIQPNAAID